MEKYKCPLELLFHFKVFFSRPVTLKIVDLVRPPRFDRFNCFNPFKPLYNSFQPFSMFSTVLHWCYYLQPPRYLVSPVCCTLSSGLHKIPTMIMTFHMDWRTTMLANGFLTILQEY